MKNVVLVLLFFWVSILARGQENDLQLITATGGSFSNANIQASWSLGEISIASFDATNLMVSQGFHQSVRTTTTTFDFGNTHLNIQTFPNPTKNILTIQAEAALPEVLYYQVRNLFGQMMMSGQLSSSYTQLDLSRLNPQMYLLSFMTQSSKAVSTIKIQKID